ncbi:hypothetical protein EMIT0P100_210017 [Pseudomonas sp. IT-P100]
MRTLKSHSIHMPCFLHKQESEHATHRNRQQKQKPSGRARCVHSGLLAQGNRRPEP